MPNVFKIQPLPLNSTKSNAGDTEAIRKAIVCGFFANAARLQPDGSYFTVRDRQKLYLHPSSVVFKHPPDWVVFHEGIYLFVYFLLLSLSLIWYYYLRESKPNIFTPKNIYIIFFSFFLSHFFS